MTDEIKYLKQLAYGAGIILFFGIIGHFFGFFFRLIAARYFGPEDFGIYTLFETIMRVCLLLGSLGISTSIPRYVVYYKIKKKYELLRGFLRFSLFIPLISSLIISILLFIFSNDLTIFFGFPVELSLFLKLLAFIIPIKTIIRFLRNLFVADKRVLYSEFSLNIINTFLTFVAMLLVVYFGLSLYYLIMSLIVIAVLDLIFNYSLSSYVSELITNEKVRYHLKDWLFFSLPLILSSMFSYFIGWSDNLIIGMYLSASDLGMYSIAFSMGFLLTFFQVSFGSIFKPLISECYAKKKNKEIRFLFRKSASWIFAGSLPIFILICFNARQIITTLFGTEYTTSYVAFIIVSAGMMINVSTGLVGSILFLYKDTKFILYNNVAISVLNIVLNLILIPIIGITGAAVSSALSVSLSNLIMLYKAKNHIPLDFDWIYNAKILLSAIIAGLITKIGTLFVPNNSIYIAGSWCLYLIIYSLCLIFFKTLRDDDFRVILRLEKALGLNLGIFKWFVKLFYSNK